MRAETELAIECVTAAMAVADSREGAGEITSKGGIDLVTATDVNGEKIIREKLEAGFPGHAIVGEELGGASSGEQPCWLVDPICGTRPYASNVPLYCTNVALVENGRVTAAAIALGKSGEVLYADRETGARLRGPAGDAAIGVSDTSNTLWLGGEGEHAANAMRHAMLLKRWYIWQFSSSIGYPFLAAGRMSGIIHFAQHLHATPVHTAAGCFIAEQAGALVTDIDGKPWDLDTCQFLLAATAELHNDLREIIEQSR